VKSPALESRNGDVLLRVKVQPKASRDAILGEQDGRIRIALTAPPVDGAANEALVRFLASVLAIGRRQITIQSGERGREKTLRLADTPVGAIASTLGISHGD